MLALEISRNGLAVLIASVIKKCAHMSVMDFKFLQENGVNTTLFGEKMLWLNGRQQLFSGVSQGYQNWRLGC